MIKLTLRNVRVFMHDILQAIFLFAGERLKNMFHIFWNSALLMTSLVVSVAVQHFSVLIVDNLINDLVLAGVGHLQISPGKRLLAISQDGVLFVQFRLQFPQKGIFLLGV